MSEVVWELLRGGLATRALALAADLRIADALADGPRPVAELAAERGADADTLHRILRALAAEGVFSETEPGVFRNTEAWEALRRDGWDDFAHLFGGAWLRAVAELGADGVPTFPRLFDRASTTGTTSAPARSCARCARPTHGSSCSRRSSRPATSRTAPSGSTC